MSVRNEARLMSKNHYYNKVPPLKPDPRHWTRKSRSWKAKVAYGTEDEAWEFLNQNPKLIEMGYKPYECVICGKVHVGVLHKHKK